MPQYYNDPWPDWVTTNATCTQTIWHQWVETTPIATVQYYTPIQRVWQGWVTTQGTGYVQGPQFYTAPPPTPEQLVAEQTRRHEREAHRRAATARARTLLDSVLSAEQKAELDKHGRFHVTGSRGRRYCIHANGQSGNVALVDAAGKTLGRFCAHPREYLPDPDAWLAQMLAIQTDEDGFLAMANVHSGARPRDLILPRR